MNTRKLLAVIFTLIAVLAVAGCGGGAGMTSTEIMTAVMEAAADIETVEFTADIEQEMLLKNGESFEMNTYATMTGVLDQVNQEMKMDIKTTTEGLFGEGEAEVMEMEQYIVDDAIYTKTDNPFTGSSWTKQTMPEGYWAEASSLEQQFEMLELADVNVAGSGVVEGTDCYELKINLDLEYFGEVMGQQAGLEGLDEMMPDFEDMIKNLSIKIWVAKDTFFPMKAETIMKMVITAEDMGEMAGEEEGEMTMDMETTVTYRNYNQPVSIVLPGEAQDAIEMPFL